MSSVSVKCLVDPDRACGACGGFSPPYVWAPPWRCAVAETGGGGIPKSEKNKLADIDCAFCFKQSHPRTVYDTRAWWGSEPAESRAA